MKTLPMSNTILILGNGFDLNLKLPTSYTHFVESPNFKNLIKTNALASYLSAKHELQRWIDVEGEFVNYSNRSAGIKMSKKEVKEDYLEIKAALIEYLKIIDINKYAKNSFVAYFILQLLQNTDVLHNDHVDVICFNYTKTIEQFPHEMLYVGIPNKVKRYLGDIIYCHGTFSGGDIVFGVEDNAGIKKDHIFFKKATQLEEATGSNKSLDLHSILKSKKNVFFIGHSLGTADYTYFKNYFMDCSEGTIKDKNIFFTYYNKEAKDSLYSEIDILCENSLSKLQKFNNIKFIDVTNADFELNSHKYVFPPKE